LRSADAQKELLDQTVKSYQDALQLTVNRFDGGAAPKSDVEQAQTQLQTTMVQDTDVGVQQCAVRTRNCDSSWKAAGRV
jgi:outer membrane protein TolC